MAYLVDAKKYMSAINNFTTAQTYLNECIRLINGCGTDSSHHINCKRSIEYSAIESLIEKVNENKEKLFAEDYDFLMEYMTYLQERLTPIDTTGMDEQELAAYSAEFDEYSRSTEYAAYSRDFSYCYLYMLEEHEKNGTLPEEMKGELEYYRKVVEQYSIQDQMAVLSQTSDQFIELFKKNAEHDRLLININPYMTEEQKKEALSNYNINFESQLDILELNNSIEKVNKELKDLDAGSNEYYEKQKDIYQLQIEYLNGKDTLSKEEEELLRKCHKYTELMDLSVEKNNLGSNWIPFDEGTLDEEIFTIKNELGIATPAEKEYLQMNGWERFGHHAAAFGAGVVEGIFKVEEQIFDGGAMLVGGIINGCGGDSSGIEELVKTDFAGDAYKGLVLSTGLNECIAYGPAHSAGNFVGEMTATVALQFVPGGTVVMSLAHGLKAAGKAGEDALNAGHDMSTAFKYSMAHGAIEGTASALLYGKVGTATKGSPSTIKSLTNINEKIPSLLNKVPGIKHVTKFISSSYNKVLGHLPKGVQSYAKSVFKPSLVTKYGVAIGKEYAKEHAGVIIGEEFNSTEFWQNAGKAVVTTTFNEFVVSPVVNKLVDVKKYKTKVSETDNKAYGSRQRRHRTEARIKNVQRAEKTQAAADKQELRDFAEKEGHSSTPKSTQVKKRIDRYNRQIENAYKNLTFKEEILGRDFVNKMTKKYGSDFMKQWKDNGSDTAVSFEIAEELLTNDAFLNPEIDVIGVSTADAIMFPNQTTTN